MDEAGGRARSPLVQIFSGRFSLLLVSIVVAFALCPFLDGFVRMQMLTDIYLTAILLAAIQAVGDRRRSFLVALALALPYIVLKWSGFAAGASLAWHFEELFGALFIAYVLGLILSFIVRQHRVTTDVIMAAVCGYFLLGLMWAFIYFFVEAALPGSFQLAQGASDADNKFIYFSFVTMTTIGYGDVLPLSNAARSLAVLEAVMGQLYLAVTIARLVGIQISQAQVDGHG
jgi:hypothetical protein